MKFFLIKLFCITSLFAQRPDNDLSAFRQFVADNQHVPVSLKKNCNWHYAVVKVNSDKNSKVTSYEVLNDANDDLKKSFSFLVGYKFDKRLAIDRRPVVFILTIHSEQEDCEGPTTVVSPTDAIASTFKLLDQQKKKQPKTIFLYDIIIKGIYSSRQ